MLDSSIAPWLIDIARRKQEYDVAEGPSLAAAVAEEPAGHAKPACSRRLLPCSNRRHANGSGSAATMNGIPGQTEPGQQNRRRKDIREMIHSGDIRTEVHGLEKGVSNERKGLQEAQRDQQTPECPPCFLDQTGPGDEQNRKALYQYPSLAESFFQQIMAQAIDRKASWMSARFS